MFMFVFSEVVRIAPVAVSAKDTLLPLHHPGVLDAADRRQVTCSTSLKPKIWNVI